MMVKKVYFRNSVDLLESKQASLAMECPGSPPPLYKSVSFMMESALERYRPGSSSQSSCSLAV